MMGISHCSVCDFLYELLIIINCFITKVGRWPCFFSYYCEFKVTHGAGHLGGGNYFIALDMSIEYVTGEHDSYS